MKQYLIQRDGNFFSSFGWIPTKREAYSFSSEEQARNFMAVTSKNNKTMFSGKIMIISQDVARDRTPKIIKEYNPYGYEHERI
jgi:hypothetical protein